MHPLCSCLGCSYIDCTDCAIKPEVLISLFVLHVVNGGWSSWVHGQCSTTSGGGTMNFTRECNNPRPSCGGNGCRGITVYQKTCNNSCTPGKIIICSLCYVLLHSYIHDSYL